MRQIVRLMPCVSVVAVLCLTPLAGCGIRSQPRHETSSSATSVPANSEAPSLQTTESQIATRGESAAQMALPNVEAAKSERQSSQPAVDLPQPKEPVTVASNQSPAKASTPEKPTRKSIYDETANAPEQIAKAVRRAQRDHKQVLIEWGGNWCGWCHLLHNCFTKVPEVAKIVGEEYELVLIDSNSNSELMKYYAGDHPIKGFPHLTILNAEGKVLTNQDTEPLEKGKGHDPELVTNFLAKWMLPKVDAAQLMSEQMELARQTDKRVLFRVGDPYCGWCKVLSQFIQDHAALFAKDYVDVKIDVMRMTNGETVANSNRPTDALGHPWFVILDPTGDVLATSVSAMGNIGYPGASDEIAHFMKMLRDTRKSLTDDDLASIEADLNDFRIRREKKLAAENSK